jgi:hypothetical protein
MSFTKENEVNNCENNVNTHVPDTAGKIWSVRKFECANIDIEKCSKQKKSKR